MPSGLIRLASTARNGRAEPWLVMVWAVLNRLAGAPGSWRGTRAELASACGTNESTIKRALRALADAGYVTVTTVPGESSLYTPNREPERQDEGSGDQPSTRVTYDPTPHGTRVTHDPTPGHIRPDPGSHTTRPTASDLCFHPPLRRGEDRELASTRTGEPTINEGASSTPPASSPLVLKVGQALAESGVTVAMVRKPEQVDQVERLVSMHGVPTLVRHARAQYRPDRPPVSMAAFLPGWSMLPPPRPKPVGPLTRPSSDHDTAPRVATEDRSEQVTAQLAEVRARLRQRRASTGSPQSGVA